jgi:hypothetical protein
MVLFDDLSSLHMAEDSLDQTLEMFPSHAHKWINLLHALLN